MSISRQTKGHKKRHSHNNWCYGSVPVIMGGLVEIVQATCTNGVRNGDWLDFLADGIGSTLAFLIGLVLVKVRG